MKRFLVAVFLLALTGCTGGRIAAAPAPSAQIWLMPQPALAAFPADSSCNVLHWVTTRHVNGRTVRAIGRLQYEPNRCDR